MKKKSAHSKRKIQGTDIETKIMPLYLEGKSMQEIADIFSIGLETLSTELNEYLREEKDKDKIQRERIKNIKPEMIFNLMDQRVTYSEIRKLYNISVTTIEKLLNQYYEEHEINKEEAKAERKNRKIDIDQLISDFTDYQTYEQLTKKYNMSPTAIRTRLKMRLPEEKIDEINAMKKKRNHIDEKIARKIFQKYYDGKATKDELAEEFGYTRSVINNIIKSQCYKMGIKVPERLTKKLFLRIIGDRKQKYTRKEIIEKARESDKIIPIEFLDEHFGKEEIDIGVIRKFVMNEFYEKDIGFEEQKMMFENFNVARILQENDYDTKHQILALIYSLPQITNTPLSQIKEALDNDEELVEALEVILGEGLEQEEYLGNLKKCEMAKNVKLAIILEELRQHNNAGEIIDKAEYEEYLKMALNTKFKVELDLAIMENNQIYQGNDR